jgi:Protein of unknown function (DUF3604)
MQVSIFKSALLCATVLSFSLPALGQEPSVTTDTGTISEESIGAMFPAQRPYSPYADRNFPTRPLFGDTHLHTTLSLDAGAAGATLGPRDAYRLARGEQVTSSTGQPVKLSRPLDFLVVTDHSDQMGLFPDLFNGKPELLADPTGRKWYDMLHSGQGAKAMMEIVVLFSTGKFPPKLDYSPASKGYKDTWADIVAAAEEYNDPGRFTAVIGYEWTSADAGNNLHRNVIFRDNGDKASQVVPYTSAAPGSNDPRDLWKWMQAYEDKTGGQLLAIAHNGNLSNGTMFPIIEPRTGKPVDNEYVETRAKWELLYEVTQMKGDGETHPILSPNDEFANFERWDKANLTATQKKTPDMLPTEYARSALQIGMQLEAKLGTNPYKFGMVGSTDSHTALSTAEEDNFWGKTSAMEASAHRTEKDFQNSPIAIIKEAEVSASGYAAVWAKDNTRTSIFDAMKRKETYATTGPRMAVRFFGGFDFEAADAQSRSPAIVGYTKGVPMGGDLGPAPQGKSPTFLVAALKDPIGANLDRYQIVKGWVDAAGETHEKVYDVVWSDDRVAGADGKLPPVGNTVDVANASWTNTIGAPELIQVWTDPDFDPLLRAVYYGRVLEIPTPRWSTYDAKYYSVALPPEVPAFLQERAYTSPIWYTP